MAFHRTPARRLHHWEVRGGKPVPFDSQGREIDPAEATDINRQPGQAAGGVIGLDFSDYEAYQATASMEHYPEPQADAQGGPPNAVPSVQVHPVWEFPTASAFQYYINKTSSQSILGAGTKLAAGVGSTLLLPELVYAPAAVSPAGALAVQPNNMFTVLRLVSIFLNNPDGTDNVSYVVRLNGAPVAGFTFNFFPRIAANESTDLSVVLRDIPQNTVLDMLFVNNAASGPWTVGGALSGWSYPLADQIAMYGNIRV